jgi:hypothetical protein
MNIIRHFCFSKIIFFSLLYELSANAQITDTLYYYYPYYPDSLNACAFVDACIQEGWCEPIAVWYTPDSSRKDTIYNVYNIIDIRFSFSSAYDSISFSIHFGDDFPTDSNKVYEQILSVDLTDINQNFLNDGIYMFKDIDVSAIPILTQLNHDINFWVRLNEKVFSVHNTYFDFPYSYSDHSFGAGLPSGQWGVSDCDWIIQAVIAYDTLTGISNRHNIVLNDFILYQNYPNPFNPSTTIKFALPKPETVTIKVYNIIGQKIETLLNKPMPAGHHEVEFNAGNLSSGVYLYRIEAGEWQDVKKMVLIK